MGADKPEGSITDVLSDACATPADPKEPEITEEDRHGMKQLGETVEHERTLEIIATRINGLLLIEDKEKGRLRARQLAQDAKDAGFDPEEIKRVCRKLAGK